MSADVLLARCVEEPLCALYRQYGYTPYKMSKFEEYDLYVKNKSFLLSENIITFTEGGGKLMALKPDVTLSIVKGSKDEGGVEKVYYKESVYRIPKGDSSFREITQVGLEYLGDVDGYALCEVLTLAAKSLGVLSDDWYLEISHVGILSALVDTLGLSAAGKERVLAMIGEKNAHGIAAVLAEEGKDSHKADALKALLLAPGDIDSAACKMEAILCNSADREMLAALREQISAVCLAVPRERVKLDLSVVNDLRYYSGIVFKGYVSGVPAAVLSGGRYDNLMKKMKKKAGAVGFAVYPDLLEALPAVGEEYDVDVAVLYEEGDSVAEVSRAVAVLCEGGERVLAVKALPASVRARRTVAWREVCGNG